ncbi:MAG: hypothetical protein H8D56_22625 [Planctomycetes bacterium]|nr:hypothetical protein [Planctomycetota bacterium]MBL7147188.1 hypothetical protein [Phycisphaerae bacterium]
MKFLINNPVKVFATGFIVLVLLSLPLFYIRIICEASLLEGMPPEVKMVPINPSGLVPDEYEKDPNVVIHSQVSAYMSHMYSLSHGILDYFRARIPGGRLSNVYFYYSDTDYMYFDKKSGLIVHHYPHIQVMPDRGSRDKWVQIYIGPEGISQTPDKVLGRFIEPIIDRTGIYYGLGESREFIVYDKKPRRFFKIDLKEGTVTKGPELGKENRHYEPIQIGLLRKPGFDMNWSPPRIKKSEEDKKEAGYKGDLKPVIANAHGREAGPYLLVLDKSGLINLLDKESLKFVENAGGAGRTAIVGWLPMPETYFGAPGEAARPQDLLGYEVWPLALTTHFFEENPESKNVFFGEPFIGHTKPSPSKIERKYLGMFAAGLSRDGTALSLSVFDEKGREIKSAESSFTKQEGNRTLSYRSSKAVFFRPPFSSTFTIVKYLVENLHPPILSLASYYTANSFEAAAGHRALFLLPNSFIAMWGRERTGNFVERFFGALGWIFPSIIFSILLATRVSKNAVVVGLSENARLYWMIGTLAFGLAAYITYRLTRPGITLVTCKNCGKMRRPDMDRCHRCKSEWLVPELTPPTWRVLDSTEHVGQIERIDESSIADAEDVEDVEDAEDAEEAATE